jgi:hypothetical protein
MLRPTTAIVLLLVLYPPVSNTALVKIRDALDEAQADLNNLAFKFLGAM